MIALLISIALAEPPPPTDLTGDGTPETIQIAESYVTIGGTRVQCGDYTSCEVEVHDLSSQDSHKEIVLCDFGIRDSRLCSLYTMKSGKPVKIPFDGDITPERIKTSGNGIVLTETWVDRVYYRLEKWVPQQGVLKAVRQPMYAANSEVHIDRTFKLLYAPGGDEVVANCRPDSDILLLVEHGEQRGWYLARLSSGVAGWVKFDTLVESSDHLMMVMSAG